LDEIYQSRLGRPPEFHEICAVRDRFVDLLNQAASTSPGAFAAVPGAQYFIECLLHSGYAVSLATGGWRCSAYLKLEIARLCVKKLPAAFADDALSRREIMQRSHQRAYEAYGVSGFDAVTYIGDGVWDARASPSLAYTFIGVHVHWRTRSLELPQALKRYVLPTSELPKFLRIIRISNGQRLQWVDSR
jgi:phosphoglycolate phosphatase-like HAD superfamily hydrolase